jgi:hypothetical protein
VQPNIHETKTKKKKKNNKKERSTCSLSFSSSFPLLPPLSHTHRYGYTNRKKRQASKDAAAAPLRTLPTDAAGKLNVLRHNRHTVEMCVCVCVRERVSE